MGVVLCGGEELQCWAREECFRVMRSVVERCKGRSRSEWRRSGGVEGRCGGGSGGRDGSGGNGSGNGRMEIKNHEARVGVCTYYLYSTAAGREGVRGRRRQGKGDRVAMGFTGRVVKGMDATPLRPLTHAAPLQLLITSNGRGIFFCNAYWRENWLNNLVIGRGKERARKGGRE